jgi:hypothetical protein
MPWYLWLALTPLALAGLLWGGAVLLFRVARRGVKRVYLVDTARGPRQVAIYVGHWLTRIWPTAAVAVTDAIWLRHPGTREDRGPVTPREGLIHELMHAAVQAPRMGWRYLPTYLWQRIALRRSWAEHRMEREVIRLTELWCAGHRTALGELPTKLANAFPHRVICVVFEWEGV